MALALLMASSVALALNRVDCADLYNVAQCTGTPEADSMRGTSLVDQMNAYEGNDTLNGYWDNDNLVGHMGDDTLNGGDGSDEFYDTYGTNTLNGGAGNDEFRAAFGNDVYGNDEVFKISGGSGDNQGYAGDEAKDTINCGRGDGDYVYSYDPGLDTLRACEFAVESSL